MSVSVSRRLMVRDGVVLTAVSLLINFLLAWQQPLPTYMDAYYYTTNGSRIANGFGLTEEVIWQYLDEPEQLPTPSHSYWMPLPSILAAAGYQFSDSYRAAQLPFVLLSSLLPLLAYCIGIELGATRWQAVMGALFAAAGGFYAGWLNQPSTFAPFALFGGVCLLFFAKGAATGGVRYWLLAGLLAGLAHLTRADGVLLLGVGLLMFVLQWWQKRAVDWLDGTAVFAGYLAIMGGWFIRNWLIWQRPLPTAGTQTIFLTTYDDLFAYGRSFNLEHLLAWGWGNILNSRLEAIGLALQNFFAINTLIFLFPFVIWGWAHLFPLRKTLRVLHSQVGRSDEETLRVWLLLLPFTLYAVLLYAVMTLVFTFPGQRGGLFHSSVALWAWCMALAPIGIERMVAWVAKRLPHWQPERAAPLFTGLFVTVAFILSLAVTLSRQPVDAETAVYQTFAAQLPSDAVVMVGNAPKFYYHTSRPALSVPNEPVEITLKAANAYGVTHLVLDQNAPIPLTSLYQQEITHPQLTLIAQQEGIHLYQINEDTD